MQMNALIARTNKAITMNYKSKKNPMMTEVEAKEQKLGKIKSSIMVEILQETGRISMKNLGIKQL